MRKSFTLLLLLVVLFQITGAYLVFRFQQIEAKHEMKSYLAAHPDHESITTIQDSPNLSWEDQNEFNLNGEMYDVISKVTVGNKTIIHCINDKKESDLLKKFAETTQQSSSSKHTSLLLQHLFSSLYEPATTQTVCSPSIVAQQPVTSYKLSITENVRFILTPPPKSL